MPRCHAQDPRGSFRFHVCGTIAGGQTAEGVSIGVAPEANLLVAGVLITTADGIAALASSAHVKAILEDQAISVPTPPSRLG